MLVDCRAHSTYGERRFCWAFTDFEGAMIRLLTIIIAAFIAIHAGYDAAAANSVTTGVQLVQVKSKGRGSRASSSSAGRSGRPGAVYYRNCAAARAAGAAPMYRGQPGYRPALDRDGDGVACEPYRRRR